MNNNSFENLLFESDQQFQQQLNQGFKEGAKKVGNFVKNNKGAIAGGALGAVVGGAPGAAVGVAAGALHDTVKKVFKPGTDKKPAAKKPTKKMNQDIDTFDDFTDMDFQKFEDDYLQNQGGWDLDVEDEMDF